MSNPISNIGNIIANIAGDNTPVPENPVSINGANLKRILNLLGSKADLVNGKVPTSQLPPLPSTFYPQGTIAFESLGQPSQAQLGYVWNISNAFTTDSRFTVSGKSFAANTNVYVIQEGSNYKFDIFANIDLTNYVSKSELDDETWTMTLDDNTTVTKAVAVWTSAQ